MKNREVVHAQSAKSAACKRSVHVNEVLRSILNTSHRLDWSTSVAPFLTEYMLRMLRAGYDEMYRRRTLEQAIRIHDRMLKDEEEGGRPIHRPRSLEQEGRRKDKRNKRKAWSTKGGCIAPIIVPSTPNGELLSMLREVAETEAHPSMKFKIVEKGGRTVKRALQKSNPTASVGCESGDCLACKGGRGTGGPCRRSNVVYEMVCQICPEDNQAVYLGETARNLYTRGREHKGNLEKKRQESLMYKHQTEVHNGMEGEYKAKVKCSFNDTLSRQVAEGVLIRRCQKNVLNSKAEWHQPALWSVRNELCR